VCRVWAKKGCRPVVKTTGSHRRTCVFGALSVNGRQVFRQYAGTTQDSFVKFLHILRRKFVKFVLFTDKPPWHRGKKAGKFLEQHSTAIRVEWFPTCSPELNPVEECWKQGKNDVMGNRLYENFDALCSAVSKYYRTKRFKLDLYKYLCQKL